MELTINGERRDFDKKPGSVQELLDAIDIDAQTGMAVAVNREVVPQSRWESHSLDEGDDIEIIRATQGG